MEVMTVEWYLRLNVIVEKSLYRGKRWTEDLNEVFEKPWK
jgi:hypothetical protein